MNPSDPKTDSSRYFFDIHNTFTNWGGWGGNWLLRGVSDDNYFIDYSRSILNSSQRVLPRVFNASRALGSDWSVLFSVQTWQAILDARPGPYERVPQLQFRNVLRDVRGFTSTPCSTRPSPRAGGRSRMATGRQSAGQLPIVRAGWSIVPKMSVHASSYELSIRALPSSSSRVRRPGRRLGHGVRAAGALLRARRHADARAAASRCTGDQSNCRLRHHGRRLQFRLFSENTFIGNDRIADVNQLTAAAVSRVIEPSTGAERFRFAVGQRIYFSQQRVAIPGIVPRTDQRSDVLLAAAGDLGRGMSFDTGLQYSVRDGDIPRFSALWRYLPSDGRIFNLGVRYRRTNSAS